MRESIRHHVARRHLLKPVVSNRACGSYRFVGVARLELNMPRLEAAIRRRRMAPYAGVAIGLQFNRH
jgi:hypothetical protein